MIPASRPAPRRRRRVHRQPQAALDLIARAETVRNAPNRRQRGAPPAERRRRGRGRADRHHHRRPAAPSRRAGRPAEPAKPDRLPEPSRPSRPVGVLQAVRRSRQAVLYYHLTRETLDAILAGQPYAGAGVVRVEDIGPVIADQVRQWLHHAMVVKPVIDLAGIPPVDRYEVSPAISEAIGLINPADSSPYGTCTSRHQDNDHTIPYLPMNRGGPPGQTDPLTMAKMTRPSPAQNLRRLDRHPTQTRRPALPLTPPLLLPRRPTRHHPPRQTRIDPLRLVRSPAGVTLKAHC